MYKEILFYSQQNSQIYQILYQSMFQNIRKFTHYIFNQQYNNIFDKDIFEPFYNFLIILQSPTISTSYELLLDICKIICEKLSQVYRQLICKNLAIVPKHIFVIRYLSPLKQSIKAHLFHQYQSENFGVKEEKERKNLTTSPKKKIKKKKFSKFQLILLLRLNY